MAPEAAFGCAPEISSHSAESFENAGPESLRQMGSSPNISENNDYFLF